MNRLSYCPRCGADVVLREGISHGHSAWLSYDAEGTTAHKFECSEPQGKRPALRTGERIVAKPKSPRMLAAAMGDVKYFGNPCVQCGGCVRYTKSNQCVACRNAKAA